MRNLCAGNEEVQQRIRELEVVTAVESPELSKLGLRLEMDRDSGQMKVVRTEQHPMHPQYKQQS